MSAQATSAEGADLQGTGQRRGIATQNVQLNGVSPTERTPQGPGGNGVQRLEIRTYMTRTREQFVNL